MMAEPPSSPPGEMATNEESIAWYKRQYEQLADELAEFRESSHELEAELEKDLDAADKRQRELVQKAETLQFEVDEWKEKCRKAKTEANAAQNGLEKEITTLRDSNRTLQLRLRDIEVANDDFERQARNTNSSLEDLESKYNVAIERSVMMEEEIKIGEQEREGLRIEAQRLREELSDLKVEAEIMQDKIKKSEDRHLSTISTDISIPESPTFENSPRSTASSPLIATPPDDVSLPPASKDTIPNEPPSPPMSDASSTLPRPASSTRLRTPAPTLRKKSRLPSMDRTITPKPKTSIPNMPPPGTRSVTVTRSTPAPAPARTATNRTSPHKGAPSASLTHIRTLTAQMQRLEARVQNARSKLPAPTYTPPRASPRSSGIGVHVPSTVTVRSRKRTVGSTSSSVAAEDTPTNYNNPHGHAPRLSMSGVSRLSFGPQPNRTSHYDPDSSGISISRPSSRASVSNSFARPERPASRTEIARPMSRTSFSGARTPIGIRPRSSIGGSLHSHSHSQSISEAVDDYCVQDDRTPSRRGTYSKFDPDSSTSSIPGPSSIPLPRRQSGGASSMSASTSSATGRRTSGGLSRDGGRARKLSDLGETY